MISNFHVYDTTLRDGAQQEGLTLTVADKMTIAGLLDELGVGFIEGGWPGAIPKDTEFFAHAIDNLTLNNAVLAAFGATRRPGIGVEKDPQVRALVESGAKVVTLVAKSHVGHVERALRTSKAENLSMIGDTVRFLVGQGRRVVLDAEHFFDGYLDNRAYALDVVKASVDAGAEVVTLCDTNGGMLPRETHEVVADVLAETGAMLGIHCHNDTGCAVANTLAAVDAGARHVQGTLNGYGERTGNADLITVVANLALKRHLPVIAAERLADATRIAHAISEITNIPPYLRQPYVGSSSFAHKAGLHASAIKVDPDLYQHIDPTDVGNDMRMLVSDMAGRATIELKGRELGINLSDRPEVLAQVTERIKDMEARGYTFEAADASFELMLREEAHGKRPHFFTVESWRVITEDRDPHTPGAALSEATVKVKARGQRVVRTGEGNGPVNALDQALREALTRVYPELSEMRLTDFKVRILDESLGTDAVTRVLIQTSDRAGSWRTVGVARNVVEASWQALIDGMIYGLLRAGVETPDEAHAAAKTSTIE